MSIQPYQFEPEYSSSEETQKKILAGQKNKKSIHWNQTVKVNESVDKRTPLGASVSDARSCHLKLSASAAKN